MSQKDKLIERLLRRPKDFTFQEMQTLLSYYGYDFFESKNGSGVKFVKPGVNEVITFHKPHPGNELKRYVLNEVIAKLKKEGLL